MANEAGQGCVARDGSFGGYTRVSEGGPASQSGSCNKLEIYASGSTTNPFKFNFFTASGNNLTAIGSAISVVAGNTDTKCHTFNAPGDFTAFSVNFGEYLGCYTVMAQHRGSSGGAGLWSKSGDYSEASGDTFTLEGERLDALSADIVAVGTTTPPTTLAPTTLAPTTLAPTTLAPTTPSPTTLPPTTLAPTTPPSTTLPPTTLVPTTLAPTIPPTTVTPTTTLTTAPPPLVQRRGIRNFGFSMRDNWR